MKKRTAFIGAILSLIPFGQSLIIKTGFFLSTTGLMLTVSEIVHAETSTFYFNRGYEKAEKGDTVLATSTRLFKGRVVEDSSEKKGESLLASTPVVVLSAILGRTPTLQEYKDSVKDIDLTKFKPPSEKPLDTLSAYF